MIEAVEDVPLPVEDVWAFQVTFLIKKEVDGGVVKKKLKELDGSVEVLVLNESKLQAN